MLLFLRRNTEVTVGQSEGVSLTREVDMNITEVKSFFGLFRKVMEENNLLNQLGKVFNVDENGLRFFTEAVKKLLL
jgi:hypothetical protein